MCRNAHALYGAYVRVSKIRRYENPYIVTGSIKHTGLEQAPKDIYAKIEFIGTWETVNVCK